MPKISHPAPTPDPVPEPAPTSARRMEPLALLLKRLREDRRLTQLELATAAGYTSQVVAVAEQGRRLWKPGTARHILKALAEVEPVNEYEAHDFLVQSRATESMGGRLFTDVFLDLIHQGIVRDPSAPRAPAIAKPAPASLAVQRLMEEAIERYGPERLEMWLRTMLSMAEVSAPPAAPEEPAPILKHEVVEKPVRRPDGHVEQIIRQTLITPSPDHATPSAPSGKIPRPSAGA